MDLAVGRSPAAAGTVPHAPALPLAPAAVARPWLPVLWQELCISLCLWQSAAPNNSQSVLYTNIYFYVCVYVCPLVLFKI